MLARSVLWNLRDVGDCLADLQQEPILRGQDVTIDRSSKARLTLQEIVELFRHATFFRPTSPDTRHDRELRVLLRAMYTEQTSSIAALSPSLPEGKQTLQALQTANQVEMKHGEVFIPLHGVSADLNWPPTLLVLVDRLEQFIGTGYELLEKIRADGTDGSRTEPQLLQSLVERLETLRHVLRMQLSQLQLVNYTAFVETQLETLVSETFPSMLQSNTTTTEELR